MPYFVLMDEHGFINLTTTKCDVAARKWTGPATFLGTGPSEQHATIAANKRRKRYIAARNRLERSKQAAKANS